MKKTVIICLLLGVGSYLQAQREYEVRYKGELLTNNQVIEIKEVTNLLDELHMKFEVEVTNTSGREKTFRMAKSVQQVMENTSNTMCWSVCMEPTDAETSDVAFPASGSSAYARPYGEITLNYDGATPVVGTSIIDYTFLTRTKGEEPLKVTVKYTYEGAPSDLSKQPVEEQHLLVSQPSGSKQFVVSIAEGSHVPLRLEVIDLFGRVLQTVPIVGEGGCTVITRELSGGCYLLALKSSKGVIVVRKGVIQ